VKEKNVRVCLKELKKINPSRPNSLGAPNKAKKKVANIKGDPNK